MKLPKKVDLHCHTIASPDGSLTERDVINALKIGKLDVIAITDHNVIHEAVRLNALFGDSVIVGEEIMTTDGEIIGLFLKELVPAGLSPLETVKLIKAQDGIVYIPHPFEKVRSGISLAGLDEIADYVDIIEIINGRSFSRKAQKHAVQWASDNDVPGFASSDSHGRIGWGRVFTQLDEKPSQNTIVQLARGAKPLGNKNGYINYLYPKLNKMRRRS